MARTPYVKNYDTWEDLPSEDTPLAAEQLQNYDDGIKGIDEDLATVETNGIIGTSQYGGTLVTNVNTINKDGFYTAYGDATGVPSTGYSWWITHENSQVGTASATQTAKAFVAGEPIEYIRNKISSTWGAWFLLPKRSDIDKLENITKYITATATTNGDFKINIANALETNLLIYVIFPNATSNTSNARISIDNGANYKNIGNCIDTTLPAVLVQNNTIILRYNGTYWEIVTRCRQPKVRARKTSNQSLGTSGNTIVFESEVYDTGNMFTPGTSQSAFIIPESGMYAFTTFMHINASVSNNRIFHQVVFANQPTSTVAPTELRGNDTTYTGGDVTITPICNTVYLEKGTTFYINLYIDVAGKGIYGSSTDGAQSCYVSCTRVSD